MIVDYDKIVIAVFVEMDKIGATKKLFKFLLQDKVSHEMKQSLVWYLIGDKFEIRIANASKHYKGWRAHYVLNTVQNKDFDDQVAFPMSNIRDMLDKEIWKELFN